MSYKFNNIPEAFYGVIDQDQYKLEIKEVVTENKDKPKDFSKIDEVR